MIFKSSNLKLFFICLLFICLFIIYHSFVVWLSISECHNKCKESKYKFYLNILMLLE